jgi:hypothetical protein
MGHCMVIVESQRARDNRECVKLLAQTDIRYHRISAVPAFSRLQANDEPAGSGIVRTNLVERAIEG